MKNLKKKMRVTKISEVSGKSKSSLENLEKFEDLCKKLELRDQFDAVLHVTDEGFDYEDQGGHLEVFLDPDGYWEWNCYNYSEDPDKSETQYEDGNGGWDELVKSLFSSDLSIFVATPYTSGDFIKEDDDGGIEFDDDEEEYEESLKGNKMKKNMVIRKSKIKEAENHEYSFLISDGNGALSRGTDVDVYTARTVHASSLKRALIKVWPHLTFDASFKDFCENYKDDDGENPMFWTAEEILDYLDSQDVSAGEAWLEAYKIDGKMIRKPEYLQKILDDGVEVGWGRDTNPEDWGIEFDDDEEEYEESLKGKNLKESYGEKGSEKGLYSNSNSWKNKNVLKK